MVQNGTNIIALDTHQHKLEFGGDTIMIELDAFKKLMEENDDRLPLLTLNEFLKGIQRRIPLHQTNVALDVLRLLKFGN